MFQVVKRDGQMDEFKIGKITSAIDKAFNAQEKYYSKEMIDLLGLRVTADFQNKIKDNKISVEEIQDSVENVLIQAGYADVAKAYDEMNTEKFQSDRHYRSQVWACCKAAVYLYGAADAGQVETICRAVGCEADAGEITRLCREMKEIGRAHV